MQLSMNDWLKQRFGNSNPFHPKEHEHLVAESSMSAADRAHSGMLPATTCLNLPALARDVMTTTSSSATPPVTSRSPGNGLRSPAKGLGKMVQNGAKAVRSKWMAHPGLAALAVAAAVHAMGANSIPCHQHGGAMEATSRKHGGHSQLAPPPLDSCTTSWRLHDAEPSRRDFPSQSVGLQTGLPGRSTADGMLAARASKGMASKIRLEAIGEAKREAEKIKDGLEEDSHTSSRSSALGSTLAPGDPREGHGGHDQREMQTSRGLFDGDALFFDDQISLRTLEPFVEPQPQSGLGANPR